MFDIIEYEDRLRCWSVFRDKICSLKDPVAEVVDWYSRAPCKSLQYDPWNKDQWPTPWELIFHNVYCAFTITLGIIYTLQFCSLFKDSKFYLQICQEENTGLITYHFSINEKNYFDLDKKEILNIIEINHQN